MTHKLHINIANIINALSHMMFRERPVAVIRPHHVAQTTGPEKIGWPRMGVLSLWNLKDFGLNPTVPWPCTLEQVPCEN